ncbi:tumor necrosis factor receptor superfamily member 13B [Zootoca vivipara]|uniref:tumor necrosis factor receptor superfamily member 13B n=1 Tax=Zootoca vivipara TaxID=8524 RepID=UPI0015914CCE|nr:tumor necrosis factor receptor superfamily member 13B [Zootoca vivipara]
MLCAKDEFWDKLLQACVSCTVTCHPRPFKGCASACSSMDCSKREGFYYDWLLRQCFSCVGICGQHPRECNPFCKKDAAPTLPAVAALQGVQCKMDSACDQQAVIYMVLGICLCTLLFSLLLTWVYFRKWGDAVICQAGTIACRKENDSPKDCLMEAGSMGSGSSGSQTPEPIETCGFCFPEASPAIQETRACHKTYQAGMEGDPAVAGTAGTGRMGTIATPEDGHFQIICSPSQEKMQVT